ncbi:hypothetical protein LTS18_002423 [Coniosporium uncinatum]|uniref:Uncharacterized protein n=1 Tax=Coniosporium uncinatum TaxID=93489 RepID=A0ACC3DE37_9PEZI|nr:hypothetical protein LTS18_002423 [Coniosporium uncinatum]
MSQPQSRVQSTAPTPTPASAAPDSTFQQSSDVPEQHDLGDGMDLIEGMDLDVDMSGLGDSANDNKPATDDGDGWVMVNENQPSAAQAAQQQQEASTQPQTSDTQVPTSMPSVEQAPGGQQQDGNMPAMFDGAEFTNFEDLDTAGDALADYEGGDDGGLDLDLDNSAFGDAFHGAEQHEGGGD